MLFNPLIFLVFLLVVFSVWWWIGVRRMNGMHMNELKRKVCVDLFSEGLRPCGVHVWTIV